MGVPVATMAKLLRQSVLTVAARYAHLGRSDLEPNFQPRSTPGATSRSTRGDKPVLYLTVSEVTAKLRESMRGPNALRRWAPSPLPDRLLVLWLVVLLGRCGWFH